MHSQIVFGVLFVDAAFPYDWTWKLLLPQYLGRYIEKIN